MRRVRERVDEMAEYCNTEVVLSVVGGKWKLLILRYLTQRTHRFGELRQAMPGITQRMLTRQLRELEDDALISRTVYPEVPPRVEYRLTEAGRSLEPLIEQFDRWGQWYRGHLKDLAGRESTDDGRPSRPESCGSPSAPGPVRPGPARKAAHCDTNK
ncbi:MULTISPECIES: winged helix-turn-helix transcriptional regulator [Streptomyces]|uniref:Winged helix-turn-helix transcriptional regulator n=1 Tax=Streptomyces ramulosus TaxID=47762 RepID=A0ABW1FPH1_9ACTN